MSSPEPFVAPPVRVSRGETEIKHSRFVTTIARVESADAALAVLAAERAAHPDARHHCWAYVIGDEPAHQLRKSSDDGEPGGTAGVPMMQVLEARRVVNAIAVVSRYFGGIKLGAGGLVRAYSGAVATTLDQMELIARVRLSLFTLEAPIATAGKLEGDLRAAGVQVRGVEYGRRARLTLAVENEDRLEHLVATLTSGAGMLEPAGSVWTDRTA